MGIVVSRDVMSLARLTCFVLIVVNVLSHTISFPIVHVSILNPSENEDMALTSLSTPTANTNTDTNTNTSPETNTNTNTNTNMNLVEGNDKGTATVIAVNPSSAEPSKLMKIWYINLDKHKERRIMQEQVASRVQVPYERFSGLQVHTLQQCLDDGNLKQYVNHFASFQPSDITMSDPTRELSTKSGFVLSVCLSHLTLYDKIAREMGPMEHGYVLVLEDDAILSDSFQTHLDELMKSAPSDWELIRLETWGEVRESERVPGTNFYEAKQPFYTYDTTQDKLTLYYGGTHAVLLKLKTLSSVIDRLMKLELTDIDSMEATFPNIRSYAVPELKSEVLRVVHDVGEQSNPGL